MPSTKKQFQTVTGQFPAVFQLSALNGQNGFKINGEEISLSGWSVSEIGDVNGDGYDDMLVGAYYTWPSVAGRSYVIFGEDQVGQAGFINLSSLNGANGFKLDGEVDGDESGLAVSGAGDVNGDGYLDFLIGAPVYSNVPGKSYLIFGSSDIGSNLDSGVLSLSDLNGVNGFKLIGEMAGTDGDKTGMSVSGVGDINRDGYDDFIIGAIFANLSTISHTGGAYVIWGSSTVGQTGVIQLSSLNGTDGFKIEGEQDADWCGYSVSSAGDVNDDGYPDILIGATYASPDGEVDAGRSYVVFGGDDVGHSGLLALSALNGANGFKVDGETPSDFSGGSVSSLGDINGDNITDFVIGAATTITISGSPLIGGPGNSYVIFGKKGIGADGMILLVSLNGTQGFRITGEGATDNSGVSVSGVEDINGDNYSDLLIGAWKASPDNHSEAGSSYLVFGGPEIGKTGLISLADLDGTNGFKFSGEQAGDLSGIAVSGAGDINADGVPDLFIGAPDAAAEFGRSYVVFGDIPPILVNNQLTINQNQTIIMDSDMLLATDANHNASQILFTIENLQHGQFQWCDAPIAAITTFSQQDILDSDICFQHDGGMESPAYSVAVNTTGIAFIPAQAAMIDFDANPVLLNNLLRIDGGQTVVLNSGILSATHTTGDIGVLLFNVTDVQHGYFNWVAAPTVAIFDFYQQNITSRLIQFIHDNSIFPPAYSVSATDGRLQADSTPAKIIFNAPKISGQFPAIIQLSSLNGQWGFKIERESCCAPYIPQWAGDINADGYSDVLLSSPYSSPDGKSSAGRSYVLFGMPGLGSSGAIYLADLNGANGFKIDGEAAGDDSGDDEQEIGIFPDKNWDFNGDGYADIVIGAPHALSNAGRSYVVFGEPKVGNNGTIDLSDLNGMNGFKLDGQPGDFSGHSISGIEDINEDGYADLIIGAPNALSNAGRSYVVFGGLDVGKSGLFNLTDLNGANGFKLNGAAGDYSGYHVRPLGDVNDDDINDLFIGAQNASPNNRTQAGSGYVIFGSATIGSSGDIDLTKLNGGDGFKINGEMSGDLSNRISSGLGDFNGDGRHDFTIGAYGHNNYTGRSYVIYGQQGIGGSGVMELSSLNGTNGFKLDGKFTGDGSGFVVRWAGDINADTYPDLLIGNSGYNNNKNSDITSGYIIFGGPWIGNMSLFNLSDLNGVHGFEFESTVIQDILWLGGIGDVNVDGIHDFIVGSIGTGVSYVIFGDMAPVFMSNQLTINQGELIQINSSLLLTADINHNASQILLSIEDLQHGQFQWDADSQSVITTFYQQDILDGHVYFQHDNSAYAPIYSVAANTTGMAWMPAQAAMIDFYAKPALIHNEITIGQGQTITLTSTELLAMHNGESHPDLLFLVTDIVHASFLISSLLLQTANISFAQQAILDGEVAVLHDDSTEPPSYQVSVTDGSSQTDPAPAAITFYKKPIFNSNQLFVKKSSAITLTLDNLCADNCSDASNDNFQFLLLDPAQYGQFETISSPDQAISSFLQKDIKAGQIQFVTDNSTQAPRYTLTVINPQTELNTSAMGSTLLLINNDWPINQGEIFNVTPKVVNATASDGADGEIQYTPVNVTHGYFALSTAPKSNISSFTQNQITAEQIIFMPDGSSIAPSITLMVDDGQPGGSHGSTVCNIDFATPPVLEHAFLKIAPPDNILLTSTNLQASDTHVPAGQLIFIVSEVVNNHFAYTSDWHTPIFNFSQQNVIDKQIYFIAESTEPPSFQVSVWNGRMMCDDCPRLADVIAPSSDGSDQNKLLEGLFSMALSIILVPVLRYGVEKAMKKYLSWRTDASLDSEIASAMLSRIWIGTYCVITRTRYEQYAKAVNYLVDELERKGDEADDKPIPLRARWRENLSYQDKENIKSVIADSVEEQLNEQSHWCCRFFKSFCRPEMTPAELRTQSPDIARRARPRLSSLFNPERSRTASGFNEIYRNMSSFTGLEEKKRVSSSASTPLLQSS